MTRAFNRKSELALMLGAGSCHPAGNNFPLFRSELDKTLVIFIIDIYVSVLTEPADFSSFYFFDWYHSYSTFFFLLCSARGEYIYLLTNFC